MNEYRLTDRLSTYWNTLRKEEPMPAFTQLNTSAIADIWQQCVLLSAQPAAAGTVPALNFQMVGDKLGSIYDRNMVGRVFMPGQKTFPGAAIMNKTSMLFTNPEPLIDNGQFVNAAGKVVKYRSCLLPFGRQGVVTHVVAGLSWREF